jgi:predicted PurR-regulated permease PerM
LVGHTIIVLATLAGVALLWQLRSVIVVFVLSLWTAAAIRPAVEFLERRGWKQSLALAVPYVLGGGLLVALLLASAMPLATELQRMGDDAVAGYEDVSTRWNEGRPWQQALAGRLPDPQRVYDDLFRHHGSNVLWGMMGLTFGVFFVVVNFVMIVVLSLYWSIDRVHFERLWLSLLPIGQRNAARDVWRAIEREAGTYLRSEALLGVAAAVVLAGGYRLLGYPYPTLMAATAGVLWLVPWLGPAMAALASLLLATPRLVLLGESAPYVSVFVSAVVTLGLLMLLEIWIEPRLFQRRRSNTLVVVLVVIGMANVFGFVGLILGPPIAAALQIVGGHLLRMRLRERIDRNLPTTADLKERVDHLRAAMAELPEPPPGLTSLVGRLESLLAEVEELPAPGPGTRAIVVYPGDEQSTPLAS